MEYHKDGVRQNNPSIQNISNAGHDEIIEAGSEWLNAVQEIHDKYPYPEAE